MDGEKGIPTVNGLIIGKYYFKTTCLPIGR